MVEAGRAGLPLASWRPSGFTLTYVGPGLSGRGFADVVTCKDRRWNEEEALVTMLSAIGVRLLFRFTKFPTPAHHRVNAVIFPLQ